MRAALRYLLALIVPALFAIPLAAGEAAHDHDAADRAGRPGVQVPVPPLTDADRAAARPPESGHPAHDDSIHWFLLFDRLEARDADPEAGFGWEVQGWAGSDLHRLWLRSDGERQDGRTAGATIELLYGRGIARWWELVAGVRHDARPGDARTFAALGIQGLAPQNFEVAATAYVASGQTAARLEAGYELLLTNRLILQPHVELDLFGRDDAARGVASGLATAQAGLRLRFEFTRRLAPYLGVEYERAFAGTADLRRAGSREVGDLRVVAGLRTWF